MTFTVLRPTIIPGRGILAALVLFLMSSAALGQTFTGLGYLDANAPSPGSFANGLSADGTIVVGASFVFDGQVLRQLAFHWSDETGMRDLGSVVGLDSSVGARVSAEGSMVVGNAGFVNGTFYEPRNGVIWTGAHSGAPLATVFEFMYFANDLTPDGSMVVGGTRLPGPWPEYDQMFSWTAEGGIHVLGMLADGGYSAATATSADGSVIVGFGDNYDSVTAIRWTEKTGPTELAGIAADIPSEARGITPDGQVIVGRAGDSAFRWSEAGGYQLIDPLHGASWSYANDVSADGDVVVGYCDFQTHSAATIWTPAGGTRDLKEFLENDHGLDLAGWTLGKAMGVSDDGRTIVGHAVNAAGFPEGFLVTLPAACPADLDGSGAVGFPDLLAILSAWGPCGACPADFDGSGDVGFTDLLFVLSVWGPCP